MQEKSLKALPLSAIFEVAHFCNMNLLSQRVKFWVKFPMETESVWQLKAIDLHQPLLEKINPRQKRRGGGLTAYSPEICP